MKKFLKVSLLYLSFPLAIQEPTLANPCFYSGNQEVCYSDITGEYGILDPNWYIEGNCYRNQLYKVMDISKSEAWSWHETICKGMR